VNGEKERIVNHEIHERHEKKKRIKKTEESKGSEEERIQNSEVRNQKRR